VKNIIKTFKIDKYSVRSVLSLYRCIPFRSNWGCFPIRRSMWARSRALCPSSSISVPPTGSSCQFISYCFLTSPVSLAVGLSPMQMDSPVCYGLVKQLTAGPPWLWVGRCYSSSGVARGHVPVYGGGFSLVRWRLPSGGTVRGGEHQEGFWASHFCFWASVEFHSHHLCYK
jgi:hypothetical protein